MSRLDNQRRLFLELLELLRPHWRRDVNQPARLQHWLAAHRAGSRDRRLYRELAYTLWRILPWVEHRPPDEAVALVATCAADTPATAPFRAAHGWAKVPADCRPEDLFPEWLADECPAALVPEQQAALLRRAPLWIRLQTPDHAALALALQQAGWRHEPSPHWPTAWRVEGEGDLTSLPAFQAGWFEVQDFGSQLLLPSVQPAAGEHWFDACAGAGGKTLQLDQCVGETGTVVAYDIRRAALDELAVRARRLPRRHRISIVDQPPGTRFDGVLVDAPCTGSGTWRRAPHLKWVTTREHIARAAQRQRELLGRFAENVRAGGRLVYATCSLCRSENEDVLDAFLQARPDFALESLSPPPPLQSGSHGLNLRPADVDSDGFFVCAFRRV